MGVTWYFTHTNVYLQPLPTGARQRGGGNLHRGAGAALDDRRVRRLRQGAPLLQDELGLRQAHPRPQARISPRVAAAVLIEAARVSSFVCLYCIRLITVIYRGLCRLAQPRTTNRKYLIIKDRRRTTPLPIYGFTPAYQSSYAPRFYEIATAHERTLQTTLEQSSRLPSASPHRRGRPKGSPPSRRRSGHRTASADPSSQASTAPSTNGADRPCLQRARRPSGSTRRRTLSARP
eukprot:scaffold10678_cov70-Phaeocystis_antarctica.AAC.3